jgi:copper(I)-binding protein
VNRALRAATMGVLLLGPLALSACSAGQVTQTANQDRDKAGPQAQNADITLRPVVLAYPDGGSYDAGDDAELQAGIVNTADEADTLTSIESDAFEGVRAIGGSSSTAAGAATSGQSSTVDIEISAHTSIFLGTGEAPTVLLENLTEGLTPGQDIELTMTFENAGVLTVRASVDNPSEELARGEAFDYHQEEQTAGIDSREASSGAGEGN